MSSIKVDVTLNDKEAEFLYHSTFVSASPETKVDVEAMKRYTVCSGALNKMRIALEAHIPDEIKEFLRLVPYNAYDYACPRRDFKPGSIKFIVEFELDEALSIYGFTYASVISSAEKANDAGMAYSKMCGSFQKLLPKKERMQEEELVLKLIQPILQRFMGRHN